MDPIEDMRLSEKDANESKTMNTHLHVPRNHRAYIPIYLMKLVMFAFSRMGFLVFDEELGYVISVLYRGHVFSFGEESDEVGFVVESAVVADL